MNALVLAGGKGERLMPLTKDTPKPLIEIGGVPLLAHTLSLLAAANVQGVTIATGYLAEKVEAMFPKGRSPLGVYLDYLREDTPLGTGGALARLGRPGGPLLVMNADVLTDLDVRALAAFHTYHGAVLTPAVAPVAD